VTSNRAGSNAPLREFLQRTAALASWGVSSSVFSQVSPPGPDTVSDRMGASVTLATPTITWSTSGP
jgi:hypothetical protein